MLLILFFIGKMGSSGFTDADQKTGFNNALGKFRIHLINLK